MNEGGFEMSLKDHPMTELLKRAAIATAALHAGSN